MLNLDSAKKREKERNLAFDGILDLKKNPVASLPIMFIKHLMLYLELDNVNKPLINSFIKKYPMNPPQHADTVQGPGGTAMSQPDTLLALVESAAQHKGKSGIHMSMRNYK